MKIIFQKVKYAICKNEQKIYSGIGCGIVIYLGISKHDTEETVDNLVNKLLKIKINDRWTKTISEANGDILLIFQETLSDTSLTAFYEKNNFLEISRLNEIFDLFFTKLKNNYKLGIIKKLPINGKYNINVCNQGPFTIIFEK